MSRSDILLTAEGLDPRGESTRVVCPRCGGGSTKEKSLSITREPSGLVLWQCFRDGCTEHGASGGEGTRRLSAAASTSKNRRTPNKVRPYRGSLERLTESQLDFLANKIGWIGPHIDIARPLWAEEECRYAFPIFAPMGDRRGYVLRSYDPGQDVKALTRMDRSEPHMSWYRYNGPDNLLLIVEDIPSAVRAARYVNSLALCGTGVGPEYAGEISAYYKNVVWALDEDALATAMKLHRKYAMWFDSSRVLPLTKDIKDLEEEEVQELLQGLTTQNDSNNRSRRYAY